MNVPDLLKFMNVPYQIREEILYQNKNANDDNLDAFEMGELPDIYCKLHYGKYDEIGIKEFKCEAFGKKWAVYSVDGKKKEVGKETEHFHSFNVADPNI